jgi:hypothetical protein
VRGLAKAGAAEAAIEHGHGLVMQALLAAGMTVVVISPNQVKNLGSRPGVGQMMKRGVASWSAEQVGDAGDGGFDCSLADVSGAHHDAISIHRPGEWGRLPRA